jgi:hypothetical protein
MAIHSGVQAHAIAAGTAAAAAADTPGLLLQRW